MAKGIFFSMPAYGHVNPTLAVVAELVRRGNSIIYYSTEEFQPRIEKTGSIFRNYQTSISFDHHQIDHNTFRLSTRLLMVTQEMIPALIEQLIKDDPDYIIYDTMSPWGKYLASILNIPSIRSIPIFLFDRKTLLSMKSDDIQSFIQTGYQNQHEVVKFRSIADHLHKTYGIPKPNFLDMYFDKDDLNIVYTSGMLVPNASAYDDSFKFVGPSLTSENDVDKFWDTSIPVIYISLGTIFNDQLGFYRKCFEAFADLDYQIVISVGSKVNTLELGTPPNNFIVKHTVPQFEILKHASLFISHGGMNSTHEALYHGVPLLLYPQALDQYLLASRVEELGAGKIIKGKEMVPSLLRAMALDILERQAYQESAREISHSLRHCSGYKGAVDAIENYYQSTRQFSISEGSIEN